MTTTGAFTTIHLFDNYLEGESPFAGLAQGTDGKLYGTIEQFAGEGTVFSMTTAGAYATVHNMTTDEGTTPRGVLVQGPDGAFYGTASSGGGASPQRGDVFKVTPTGAFTLLHSFVYTEGFQPMAGLTLGPDGNFYGVNFTAGPSNIQYDYTDGTIFKITPTGTVTLLHDFANMSDCGNPLGPLTLGPDGYFYGTASNGGPYGMGAVFRIKPDGSSYSIVYAFHGIADGAHPQGRLIFGPDGNIYGTTYNGFSTGPTPDQATGDGTVFRLTVRTPASDFNGDGLGDLILQNASTNVVGLWYMNGPTRIGAAAVSSTPGAGWKAVGCADFNGDGHPDLVLQNLSTHKVAVWYLNGATLTGGAYVSISLPAGWSVAAVADINGDGHPDLVVQNTSTHQAAAWYLNNVTLIGSAYVSVALPAGWSVIGAGDFNGDLSQDLLLQNGSTRQCAFWYMNKATVKGSAYVNTIPPAGWVVAAIADTNGDGKPEMVLQNTSTNVVAIWTLNNAAVTGGATVTPTPAAGWAVVGPK
jgi:uncharacterized repeat protein (TIGR03803 family)